MGIIAALLMFNCNLHFNQLGCVETHVKCVTTMSTIKIGGLACMNRDQRLAAAYLYCVETGGDFSGSSYSYSDYADLVTYLANAYATKPGFNIWEKPGYWAKITKKMQTIKK